MVINLVKAYIIHLFDVCGGGELVSLELCNVLNKLGYDVTYITNCYNCIAKCCEKSGVTPLYDVEVVSSMLEKLLSVTGRFFRFRRLLLLKSINKLRSKLGKDALVIDSGTNYPSDVDICYIHYPAVDYEKKGLIWWGYEWLIKKTVKGIEGKPKLTLCNSSWTARKIKEKYGLDAYVLHPPVDVNFFRYDGSKKWNGIVTISRFTPEKKLEELVKPAKKLVNYYWIFMGNLGNRAVELDASVRVYNTLVNLTADQPNIKVMKDVKRVEMRTLLHSSKYYVHPPFPEHFGISVVEAMAAGCIPIVYRDGGAWYDIVSKIDRGLGYSSVDEIPEIIHWLDSDEPLLKILQTKVINEASKYSVEKFRSKAEEYIKMVGK